MREKKKQLGCSSGERAVQKQPYKMGRCRSRSERCQMERGQRVRARKDAALCEEHWSGAAYGLWDDHR